MDSLVRETPLERRRRIEAYSHSERVERLADLRELSKWNQAELLEVVVDPLAGPLSAQAHIISECQREIDGEIAELEGRVSNELYAARGVVSQR